MYNAHSYLGTDKIQTYKNTCVGWIGYALIYLRFWRFKTTKYTCFIHHRNPKPNYYQIGCLDNAFDLVNRTWRYSGNQINTVVFMICLKKEILRGLEPILFEGQMLSDFLQDLVCTCKRRSVCSKGCVCFELNLSCTELCLCQALDLCHNVIPNRTEHAV
jgi:hypothetical protein